MKQIFLWLAALLIFAACGNSKTSSITEEVSEINNSVLGVSLMDNRSQVIQKIEDQGYKIADKGMYLTMEERYSFSGHYFDNLTFTIFDAKVYFISISNEYDTEDIARAQYAELEKELMEKYSKFKTNNTNDGFLAYTEFDDNKTNLTLSILYHPKEDVPPLLQDAETLHNAREYWELLIIYNTSKNASSKAKSNDF